MRDKTLPKSDDFSVSPNASVRLPEITPVHDLAATAHEERVRNELNAQFRELKRQARGVFEAVKGRIGASNEEYLEQVFAKARADYSSGNFLIQRMGAERQLDLPLVATLTQLRQGLLVGIPNPGTADQMLADTAIMSYRNLLRVQGWLGSLCLEVERGLFNQEAASSSELREVEEVLKRIEERVLPLSERCTRMLLRTLDALEARTASPRSAKVSIGMAGQVNLG